MVKKSFEELSDNMVKVNGFYKVASNKKVKGSSLESGSVVIVASLNPLPEKRSDPYLQRIYAVVFLVEDGLVQIPKEDNDYQSILVDPRVLTAVSEEEEKKFVFDLKEQFDPTPDTSN